MVEQPRQDLRTVITILESEKSEWYPAFNKTGLYEIGPWEFLSFAKQDLQEDSERGRINALSNAKRAIECRVDEFLTLSNLRWFCLRNRWGLRYKLLVLKTFGISAPDVLTHYIVSKRNLLEHEYTRPKSTEETRYVADIAELFLSATERFVQCGHLAQVSITRVKKGEMQKTGTAWDKSTDYEERYKLRFDLAKDQLTVTREEFEQTNEFHRNRAELRSREKAIGEPTVAVIDIRNCKETDFRDLIRLIRQKADQWEQM